MDFMSYETLNRDYATPLMEGIAKSASAADVFLSYSHSDGAYVHKVGRFLSKEFGVKVYIDTLDGDINKKPTPQRVHELATRAQEARRLIVLVSPSSADSSWVQWELGLGHGSKGYQYVGAFPIAPSAHTAWKGNEYLNLYPAIQRELLQGDNQKSWAVSIPWKSNRFWYLNHWLTAAHLTGAE